MNPSRRTLLAAMAFAPFASLAQNRDDYMEIKPPYPVDAPAGKIEVAEFFWYGCIHCYNLEPRLETWLKKLPADAQFRRIPAIFNQRWALDAAIYYAFEAMGVLDKVHRRFFDAIHRDRLDSAKPDDLAAWLGKNGVDPKKFNETLKSFGVQAKTKRAAQLTVASKIDGTPAMGVQGRYIVGASDRMLDTVSELISTARKQK